jgi:hypothetical protein
MRQLLVMAFQCHTSSQVSLIHQRNKTKDVRGIGLNLDPNSLIVNIVIDGVLIAKVQVDGSSNVNSMNAKTMKKIGLTQLKPTTHISRMVD